MTITIIGPVEMYIRSLLQRMDEARRMRGRERLLREGSKGPVQEMGGCHALVLFLLHGVRAEDDTSIVATLTVTRNISRVCQSDKHILSRDIKFLPTRLGFPSTGMIILEVVLDNLDIPYEYNYPIKRSIVTTKMILLKAATR